MQGRNAKQAAATKAEQASETVVVFFIGAKRSKMGWVVGFEGEAGVLDFPRTLEFGPEEVKWEFSRIQPPFRGLQGRSPTAERTRCMTWLAAARAWRAPWVRTSST